MSDSRTMIETGLGLGSNLGNRLRRLCQAKMWILMEPHVLFVDQSAVYETEPVGVKPEYQAMDFLNAVLIVKSPYTAETWLTKIRNIETALGRVRTAERNVPRTMDIDLLFCGDQQVANDQLQVPHPRWAERSFVVRPLADIRPKLALPGTKYSVEEILAQQGGDDKVRLFSERW